MSTTVTTLVYFSINTTDLTGQINKESSYKVTRSRVYTSIKDANGVEYRNFYRGKVIGSFEMYFVEGVGTSFDTFLTLIANNTASGVLLCSVYVQNTATTESINCFCDIEVKKEVVVNGKRVRIVTVNIEEC